MAQNIYDDEEFFTNYSRLRRSIHGLDGAPEWPTIRGLLPPIAGRRVVDLGCGFGWFCRWAAAEGAASVLGIDVSARMLDRARADTTDERIEYRRADLDDLDLDEAECELAYSSLTLHYLGDLDRLFERVARALVEGGSFVFSVEHPIVTAPSRPEFVDGEAGTPVWPVDDYFLEGPRVTEWLVPGVVKQHRTVETYLRALRRAGFQLEELVEWAPSTEQIAEVPEWAIERGRPSFLLVGAIAAS